MVATSVIAFFVRVMPVAFMKIELYKFSKELKRTVEISGRVGIEAYERELELKEQLGINPDVEYSKTGNINIGDSFSITLKDEVDMSFWGIKATVPLIEKVVGTSEVYHK